MFNNHLQNIEGVHDGFDKVHSPDMYLPGCSYHILPCGSTGKLDSFIDRLNGNKVFGIGSPYFHIPSY